METSWVDLLDRNGLKSPARTKLSVKVSDRTPNSRMGTKWNASKGHHAYEKVDPGVSPPTLEVILKEKCTELERTKSSLALAHLTATQLEKSVEEKDEALAGILAHVRSLQSEVQHLSSTTHTHGPNNTLLSDMERLMRHNGELCERLAATQHSRTVLERELVGVKRSLLEEKAVSGRLEQLLSQTIKERDELGCELDERLQTILQTLHNERTAVELLTQEKADLSRQLESYQCELERQQTELRSLKETQVKEIERRCGEVDVMKSQLERELAKLETERVAFLSREREGRAQLEACSRLAEQLKSENESLSSQLKHSQSKSEVERSSLEKANHLLQDQLEQTAREFEGLLADHESTRNSSLLLQQQVTDLNAQVVGMREQLSGRCELANEMKALLDQRAARIRELERTVSKHKKDLSLASMDTSFEVFNVSRESQDDVVLSESSSVVSSLSPGRARSSRFNSSHTEVLHLKQRLSESRRQAVCLEVQLAQIKTDNAKLLGSQQALASIRTHLTEENTRLSVAIRENGGLWEREREGLHTQLSQLEEHLAGQQRDRETEREQLRAQVGELSQLTERGNSVAACELHRQIEAEREKASLLQHSLAGVSLLIHHQVTFLNQETGQCTHSISTLRAEAMQLQETSRITKIVNDTRSKQIEEREESVAGLLGEVEALRARKMVVEQYLRERVAMTEQEQAGEKRNLESEVYLLHEKLKNCTCTNEGSHDHCLVSHDQCRVDKADRLLSRLKSQKRQTNFVRMKLGYALSELRLYKQLKVAMDSQIARLQGSVASVQERYRQCLERVREAEELGFGTNHRS